MDKFLAMWDMDGLEYLVNLSEYEKDVMWARLKGVEPTMLVPKLPTLIVRARANMQRHYEIYIFETADFTEEDLKELFADSPQLIVDQIRKCGFKVYSDRLSDERVIV